MKNKQKERAQQRLIDKLEECENSSFNQKSYSGLRRLIYNLLILGRGCKKNQVGANVKIHTEEGVKFLHLDHNSGKKAGNSRTDIKKVVKLARSIIAK